MSWKVGCLRQSYGDLSLENDYMAALENIISSRVEFIRYFLLWECKR
jgi:hypothetical protein